MCANDKSGPVSSERLKQFLEAVEELKGVDSNVLQSVVKKMMKFYQKEKNENITKEEFIAWCVFSKKELSATRTFVSLLAFCQTLTCAINSYQTKPVSNMRTNNLSLKKN